MFHFNNHLSSIQHNNYTTLLKDTRMLLEAQQHWITFMSWFDLHEVQLECSNKLFINKYSLSRSTAENKLWHNQTALDGPIFCLSSCR